MTSRRRRGSGDGPADTHGLTGEDARLWELVRGRITPLARRKARMTSTTTVPVAAADAADNDIRARPSPPAARPKPAPLQPPIKPPPIKPPKPAPTPVAIEHRKTRDLARGKRIVEAVLDLHGMRQVEAHAALRGFVRTSQASGAKFVKVITGKGARSDAAETPLGAPERGVLKRLVPLWLREPDLAPLVVGIASAGRGHGGEGALYVELRRPRDRPGR